MPDSIEAPHSTSPSRLIFAALGIIDAALLVYLALQFDWLDFHVTESIASPAATLIYGFLWVLLIGSKLALALFFVAIGVGIARAIVGRAVAPRWQGVLASLVLLPGLVVVALDFVNTTLAVLQQDGPFVDRLTFYDALARVGSDFGTVGPSGTSVGASLASLLVAAYLSEKYLLWWWRIRWPIAVLPVLAVAWVAWSVHQGEQTQREFVATQQWRPVAEEQTWIGALAACENLGPGWRLPSRGELPLYLATQPGEIAAWKRAAWTMSATQGGTRAIGVDLAPRKSGRWDKRSQPLRDESPCELRDGRGYSTDWVAQLRPDVCAHTTQSPALYPPGFKFMALRRGNVSMEEPMGAAICVLPAQPDSRVGLHQRGYPEEKQFTRVADFKAAMQKVCGRETPTRDRGACFLYAPNLGDFIEDGDERTFRAFCDLAGNGHGCANYAELMDRRPGQAERAAAYRARGCALNYAPACSRP